MKYFSRSAAPRGWNTANVQWERHPSVFGCLEAFGRRELHGQDPWQGDATTLLRPLHRAILAARDPDEAARMIRYLHEIMDRGPWAAIGVWRFVFAVGPRGWLTDPGLREGFLAGLRAILGDPHEQELDYRPNPMEEMLIRQEEPDGGPLWRLLARPDMN